MLTNRIILIFLGIIFLIIILLSSKRLSAGIRNKVGGILPNIKPLPTVVVKKDITPTLTPTPGRFITQNGTSKGGLTTYTQTPNTGPSILPIALLSLLGAGGIAIKRITEKA